MNSILSFWVVYILTRPLGASIGDYLSQPHSVGGRGLGTTTTSYLFLAGIALVVAFLTVTKKDVANMDTTDQTVARVERHGLAQTVAVAVVVISVSVVGYNARKNTLTADTTTGASAGATKLGDLSAFRIIATDTLNLLSAGTQKQATSRIGDMETAWDVAQARLQARDKTTWTLIDGKIDTVLRSLRTAKPNPSAEVIALKDLLAVLK